MRSAVPTLEVEGSNATLTRFRGLDPDGVRRQMLRRRKMSVVHAIGYIFGTFTLLVYSYAGAVSPLIPSAFFLSGLTVIGIFTVLSEINFNDRFEDHYLTVFQVAAHVLLQICFLLAAPQIGYAFLGVLFLIFALGSLRLTPKQVAITWGLTTVGVTPVFLLGAEPISMITITQGERFAASFAFVLTLGQCAFVGFYGNFLRRALYKRGAELREAYKRIEEIAEIDDLTGSFNRRCIMRMLDEEIVRAQRSQSPLTVALIDLDWFKRINDTFGHPTGDEVLRTFAITMFANIRSIDRLGRYGGEEFLLLLPGTPGELALHMVDRQRSIVSQLDWSAFSDGLEVTISAGVAVLGPKETSDSLLARADKALYSAKELGRNRIVGASINPKSTPE